MSFKGEKQLGFTLCAIAFGFIFLASCVSPKKVTYFNYLPDSLKNQPVSVQMAEYSDPKIQPNDLLQISVQTIDPQATNMIGTQSGSAANGQTSGSTTTPGYLVDQNGEIEMPLVGRIKVAGLTTVEVRNAVAQRASQYYKNPVVNVRYANMTITVLGEVTRPGPISVPTEKLNIIDAIGMAGDLTMGGKRDNIILLREENNQKVFYNVNLNDRSLFQSPYFYLRQRDVLYVPPTKNRVASTDVTTTRTLAFLSTAVSIATLIIALVRF